MNRTESVHLQCPYCGETIEIVVDCSIEHQIYIEDCEVCCQPLRLEVSVDPDGTPSVAATREDDA
ncbi:MAG: CPXCG motif-containing cysteine-rich protein [Gammaproteobacteria bacterium]